MTTTPLSLPGACPSPSARRHRCSQRLQCSYLLVMVLGAPAIANATASTGPAATSLVSVEDDDGYLRRDDQQPLRQRSRQAPGGEKRRATGEATEPLGVGGVLLVGVSVFLTAGAVALPATVVAAVCLALPFVGVVLAIGALAAAVGLPSLAGSSVAEALGADGGSVQLGAAIGAGVGIAGGLAVGAGSVVVGLGTLIALAMAAEARGTAGNGVALGVLPIFGLATSAGLTLVAIPALTAVGAGLGALAGGIDEMGAGVPSGLNE